EFSKAGMAFARLTPDVSNDEDPPPRRRPIKSTAGKLVIAISAAKLEKWGQGDLEVSVVNPGEIKSNAVKPKPGDPAP
ncbi:MAG TPA: hypothetical protein VFV34_23415, partial [Blastocatellia bacterium]|nr:hypothetical protein [Blastocatellia bacterium]